MIPMSLPIYLNTVEQALSIRNESWKKNTSIPKWVKQSDVGLDCFYTDPDIAFRCIESLYSFMKKDGTNPDKYHFIEPSAGTGVFYDLMPKDRRTGIDILTSRLEFVSKDYLSWFPPNYQSNQYVVLGNPPFGYRGWLALAFMNHSAIFSDYIGFILPMAFQSNGKGSPKSRVKGAELVLSEKLPSSNIFKDIDGNIVKINTIWQIWRRGINRVKIDNTCNDWIDLFTVDTHENRLCGQNRMSQADYFLQRTFYKEPPVIVKDFSEVRYNSGYGIIIKKEYKNIESLLYNTDWLHYSNLAVHNCRHISMYHIRQAIMDKGFIDDQ